MKNSTITAISLGVLVANPLLAANTTAAGVNRPRGRFIELHSCEVYAGGCVVSSEAPQGGRYMVRLWEFTAGSQADVDLSGLQLAVLQVSPENLAVAGTQATEAVVYLPAEATTSQREALLSFLANGQSELQPSWRHTRVVPMHLARERSTATFTAGEFLALKVRSMESCDTGSCGEQLWYKPRTPSSVFTVGFNRGSQVREPLLRLTWTDAGKRSVFLARFGQTDSEAGVNVSSSDFCGSAEALF